MKQVMSSFEPHYMVLDVKWRQYNKQFHKANVAPALLIDLLPQKRNIAAGGRAKASKDEGNVLIKQLSQTPKDMRLNMMMEFVKQLVIRVLVRDPDADFDIHMTLTDMGMDSLMVREYSNMLGKQIGKKLSVTLDYDYPNVAAIAAFLLSGLKITDVVAIAEALAPAPTPKADKIERPISRPQNRY